MSEGIAQGAIPAPDTAIIIGLGYVGLPLAKAALDAGVSVIGYDLSARVVSGLNAGRSHIDDLSDADIAAMRAAGFEATTDPARIASAGVVVICVPTPLGSDGGPDLRAVLGATAAVARHMSPGTTVILESTTYPGTTDEVVRPLLEDGGRTVGEDFYLAFSPERIDPGRKDFGPANTPKVVGGCTPGCARRAGEFYGRFVSQVVPVKGTREAEMAKLIENTYRHVNIALVNEMARFCHDLDIDLWESIRAAATKPFGFQAFYPGPGVGGHCIPIDPNYLSHRVRSKLKYQFRFVELAQDINAGMPAYVVSRTQELLNDRGRAVRGSRVVLLGVTYKADIADQRETPATDVARGLLARGADVRFHDPYVASWSVDGTPVPREEDLAAALGAADVAIVLQFHRQYTPEALTGHRALLFDTRGRLPGGEGIIRL